MMKRRSSKEL